MAETTQFDMQPLLPAEGSPATAELTDLAFDLTAKAAALAGTVPDAVAAGVGSLVRAMNCYYSNLIEGHNTHPRDIERALASDFSNDPEQRDLQLEAAAHIAVQEMVDVGNEDVPFGPTEQYVRWLHRAFCERLPESLLWVEDPDTGERYQVVPGEIRERHVVVGRHVPPEADAISPLLERFAEAYDPDRLGRAKRVIAVSASHHRLVWIHPFLDGNGRVARMLSHAYLRHIGLGSALWSVSRGLARTRTRYREVLAGADHPRQGDLDGRGALSEAGLVAFCRYFLETCIDQVDYMSEILDPARLLVRMERQVGIAEAEGILPKRSFSLLREALMIGTFHRGQAPTITGYQERKARQILSELLDRGYLVSDGPRAPARLGFPVEVLADWFPRLYPEDV